MGECEGWQRPLDASHTRKALWLGSVQGRASPELGAKGATGRHGLVRAGPLLRPEVALAPPHLGVLVPSAVDGGDGRPAAQAPERPVLRPSGYILSGVVGGRWRLPPAPPCVLRAGVLGRVCGGVPTAWLWTRGAGPLTTRWPVPLPAPRRVARGGRRGGCGHAHRERRVVGSPAHPRSGCSHATCDVQCLGPLPVGVCRTGSGTPPPGGRGPPPPLPEIRQGPVPGWGSSLSKGQASTWADGQALVQAAAQGLRWRREAQDGDGDMDGVGQGGRELDPPLCEALPRTRRRTGDRQQ